MSWFTDGRFGMFIHWGLYSAAGGCWRGMETPWVSEWMMRKFQIPRSEYARLAESFTAENFDADFWVRSMAEAGMKYFVITSKHHDGFAMFDSSYDDYNIVKRTPFGRDPLKELVQAAEKYQIRVGFYYSHEQDWNEAGAVGNTWDFAPEKKSDEAFEVYLQNKVRHQVRELLTNYGKISMIWFDTPHKISEAQSERLLKFVKDLQPEIMVNSRIGGKSAWDYESLGDNVVPSTRFDHPAEGIGTMNESWGYKPSDHGYRTTTEILQIMARLAACGANYMLNVGPNGSGEFPSEAQEILRGTGAFLKLYGEALYNTSALPISYPLNRWGEVTWNGNALYFWCFRNPGELLFYGIRNKIRKAEILHGAELKFCQQSVPEYDYHKMTLVIPPDCPTPLVIKVTLDGVLDCNECAYEAGTCNKKA